jgi:hypothetical protein
MDKDEKKLYKQNDLGYNLILFFIFCTALYSIFTLKKMTIDYKVGIFVVIIIFVSLISFLAAVKLKIYSIKWGYTSIVIGISQFALLTFKNDTNVLLSIILFLGIAAAVAGGIVTIIRGNKREAYISKHNISV